ncbi:MAG: phosphate signaling complex protein PhoU [Acidobacteriota bacterium]|nr:phosphate signaling complex protein PhoU [Acidobacteriota bacterium]
MSIHLQKDLEHLDKELLILSSMVEDATNKAILALVDRRLDLARQVMREDDRINTREVLIEEECLKMLALHQPVAADLRFIVAVLKVNNDLERMGDLAVNIAERAAYLATREPLQVSLDFPKMAEGVREMVRESLDALTNMNPRLARHVLTMDDEIDEANRGMFDILQDLMHRDPSTIERAVHLLSASRHLERIADLATNIAQDVVYIAEGRMIRHLTEDDIDRQKAEGNERDRS